MAAFLEILAVAFARFDDDVWSEERRGNGDDNPAANRAPSGIYGDAQNHIVDGVRDLLDFFPLHFDLEEVLKVFPADQYKYVIKHTDEALKYYEFR